jgi:hypothetical protein
MRATGRGAGRVPTAGAAVSGVTRGMVAVGLAAVGALALGALTRAPYTVEDSADAELRLTWRARASQVEECRRLTEAEQEALPVHMRREVICEGRVASYRLEVRVDGEIRHGSTIRGAGARGDRPLYVFDAIRLPPGRHEVDVVFERIGTVADTAVTPPRSGSVPDRLELRESLELAAGEVALVTYDATERRLVLRQNPSDR